MIIPYQFIHFLAIAVLATVSSIGIVFGQALATNGFFNGFLRQPAATKDIKNILFPGMFLIEGPFILAFLLGFIIFSKSPTGISLAASISELGIAIGMAISACFGGLTVGKTIQIACQQIAKQPKEKGKIQTLLIILLTLIDTPVFFTFTICLFVLNKITPQLNINDGYRLFSATLAVGLGTIGPSVAQYIFVPSAIQAAFFKPENFNKHLNYIVITEAFIETNALLSFIIALFLTFKKINPFFESNFLGLVLIITAVTLPIGGMMSSINIGKIGKITAKEISTNISIYQSIFKSAVFFQIIIETCGLFSFIISLILIGKLLF